MNNYTRSHTVENDDALVNYHSNVEYLPDLLVWYPVTAGRKGDLALLTLNKIVSPYLENMMEDEAKIVAQQLAYVARIHTVTGVDAYDDMFIVHVDLAGQAYSAIVCVANMMAADEVSQAA